MSERMATFVKRTEIAAPREALWAWHAKAGAFERLNPPWDPVVIERRSGGLEVGSEVQVKLMVGPVPQRWTAVHTAYEEGRLFRDEQRGGPFRKWVHTHRFLDAPNGSVLEDEIEYQLPLGGLGQAFGGSFASDTLERVFAYRHRVTALDLQRHQRVSSPPRVIAVTGASGLVGSALVPFLQTAGHSVRAVKRLPGNVLDAAAFEGVDAVIHLAGAGVADQRWSAKRKAELVASRVDVTRQLVEALGRLPQKPEVLISASAIGVYGDRGDEVLNETSAVGSRGDRSAAFLASLCLDWEAEARKAQQFGIRVAMARIGLVQAANGGALSKLLTPFKAGLGGPVGHGKQWQSWVALEDVLGAIQLALSDAQVSGPFNVVGPAPVTSADYASVLGGVLRRPALAPLPAFALRTMFGELADGALLASQRVEPTVLAATGFSHAFSSLGTALRHTLGQAQ
jgi:uncharacterized protein